MSSSKLPAVAQRLLRKRGIAPEAWDAFLSPDFARDLHDPFLLPDMEAAVTRLINAHAAKEPLVVFGDYDADGIPATAVLVRALTRLGFAVTPIIPTRVSGYGLTPAMVERIIATGTKLLVTVDNGTVSKEEAAMLQAAGVDVIVCDHHEPQEEKLARPLALVNPKLEGSAYPFSELCGCALAWKLAWAVCTRLGLPCDWLKWELDLVALSTVADMVPMLGENRALVQFGLLVLRKTRNVGLQALAAQAKIDLAKATSADLGYRLAPRLNAPSRMHGEEVDGQNVSLSLLITDNSLEAQTLAAYLQECNVERQGLLEQTLAEALEQAEAHPDDLILVVYGPEWSTGVIGLVAGRLMEKRHRPTVVLAREGEEIKGSVRSLDGVGAVDMLAAGESFLERYGGHAKAGGLTMKAGANVDDFRAALNQWAEAIGATPEKLETAAELQADERIGVEEATLELAEAIATLAPFGIAFPEPLFESICELTDVRPVGALGQHLSCRLSAGGARAKGIAFGAGQQAVVSGAQYVVRYQLSLDEWQGSVSVSCIIRDLRLLEGGDPAIVGA